MTEQLYRLSRVVQRQLLDGPWPPSKRVLVDAWASFFRWHECGEHVFRVRDRSPAIAHDLPLSSAPVRREAQCYMLEGEWIVLSRIPALHPIPVHGERVLSFRQPLLTYCTETESSGMASGYFNLIDQPTPRELQLMPGTSIAELWSRNLDHEEISTEALRIVRTLPFFFGS